MKTNRKPARTAYTFEELVTTPVGPKEPGRVWYAGSRVATNTLGAYIWGHNCGLKGMWMVLMSRVLEKPGEYSCAIIWRLVAMMTELRVFEGATRFEVWTDTGPHYRCWKFVGTLSMPLLHHLGCEVRMHFGLEHHMKQIIDGLFQRLNFRVKQRALLEWVNDTDDLVRCHIEAHQLELKYDPERAPEIYENFMPCEKKDVVCVKMDERYVPCLLTTCHSWSFSLKDRSRTTLYGRGVNSNTATNVIAKAAMLPDRKCDADKIFQPVRDTRKALMIRKPFFCF